MARALHRVEWRQRTNMTLYEACSYIAINGDGGYEVPYGYQLTAKARDETIKPWIDVIDIINVWEEDGPYEISTTR